ncbi:MAG: hypothetical protein KA138_07250 [Saprospiraceae bacterium]|jgi:hypothetical protein|nr:hypothetical protein [Saprospiraceae bacterium]
MEYVQNPSPQKFSYTPATKQEWLSTSTWAVYFAVLGFVLSGLYVLALLATLFFVLKSSAVVGMYLNFLPSGVILGIVLLLLMYVAAIFVMFIGSRHHLHFSQRIKLALQHNNQSVLEEAWRSMRKAWKVYGIYTVIMLGVYFVLLTTIGYMMQSNPFLRGY